MSKVPRKDSKSGGQRKAGRKAPDVDLKGKMPNEVLNARITVWYEENSPRGKIDVPYVGVVTGHKREGITVRVRALLPGSSAPVRAL